MVSPLWPIPIKIAAQPNNSQSSTTRPFSLSFCHLHCCQNLPKLRCSSPIFPQLDFVLFRFYRNQQICLFCCVFGQIHLFIYSNSIIANPYWPENVPLFCPFYCYWYKNLLCHCLFCPNLLHKSIWGKVSNTCLLNLPMVKSTEKLTLCFSFLHFIQYFFPKKLICLN